MKVMTTWQGKRLFTSVGDSGYSIGMDATPAYGGDGKGATPMELVLAGLAGCIGIDVTMILDQFLGSVRSIEIEADGARKEQAPTGFTSIDLIFKVDGDIPDYRVWKAIEMGSKKYCAVSDSLKADIQYKLVLNGIDVSKT
ncbi:OsmC family protein [Cohnella lupini]|uniref:Putative redox protein n=1 Tax=Cohnella lupini TaxID=1294267 RepID=A0A3D9INX6_9BACL|nr:OsmC family protein [Cohnella lupini]RED63209.1 putative redox protein [Cohnella lupini]